MLWDAQECPACHEAKRANVYICGGCWATLQPAARRALNRRDDRALQRLRELLDQLAAGVPLYRIEIAA